MISFNPNFKINKLSFLILYLHIYVFQINHQVFYIFYFFLSTLNFQFQAIIYIKIHL